MKIGEGLSGYYENRFPFGVRFPRYKDILGIPLLDHILVGDDRYYSFKEGGGL